MLRLRQLASLLFVALLTTTAVFKPFPPCNVYTSDKDAGTETASEADALAPIEVTDVLQYYLAANEQLNR